MKKVAWSNLWNWTNSGGHGSRVHLTNDEGLAGTTLCGKDFPRRKGSPVYGLMCKRCWKKAKITTGELNVLPFSPNTNE